MRKIKLAEISIISVLIWIGCIIFSNICYEECDDINMNFIAAGAYVSLRSIWFTAGYCLDILLNSCMRFFRRSIVTFGYI